MERSPAVSGWLSSLRCTANAPRRMAIRTYPRVGGIREEIDPANASRLERYLWLQPPVHYIVYEENPGSACEEQNRSSLLADS